MTARAAFTFALVTALAAGARAEAPAVRLADDAPAEAVALAATLGPLLEALPPLGHRMTGSVALVPRSGGASLFSMRWTNPEILRAALQVAVTSPPYEWTVKQSRAEDPIDELARGTLTAIAERRKVDYVMVYGLAPAAGDDVTVKVAVFDVEKAQAYEQEKVVTAPALTRRNPAVLPALCLALLAIGLAVARGKTQVGGVRVEIKRMQGATRETIVIRLSKDKERPVIENLQAFDEEQRAKGARSSRFEHSLVDAKEVVFDKIPAGQWFVHLLGARLHGGFLEPLGEAASQLVNVKAGETAFVRLDLAPNQVEFCVRVIDGEDGHPVLGALVFEPGDRDRPASTNERGEVTLALSRGFHTLHLVATDLEIAKEVDVGGKVDAMTIDLARERKERSASGGIDMREDAATYVSAARPPMSLSPFASQIGKKSHPPGYEATLMDDAISLPEGFEGLGASFAALVGGSAPMPQMVPVTQVSWGAPAAMRAGDTVKELRGLMRYKAVGELGRGAMGVVYKARDLVLERDVALKLVGEDVKQHPDALKMFLSEAKSLAALNHPNIVTVFDQGQDGRETYMVMEFVEGRTVDGLLKHYGKMSLGQTLEIGEQVCAGLQYAHARRILHRDIKPANIFVSTDGVVKIGDFGLARAIDQLRLAQTKVCGTPLYMSPEQIRGTDVDFRADLYALGCTLYELLVGHPPFTTGEVMFHHMYTEPPSLTSLDPAVPPEVNQLVLDCLVKDKERRVASAEALRGQLKALAKRFGE